MERYKKRTIALCLASLLTVVGAFGAENYSNSLMGLKINNSANGYINITAYTQKPFTDIIKTNRTDKNTYEITLENTTSDVEIPDLSQYKNIESLEIATAPYTNNSSGYTKITVKTIGSPVLKASSALFVPGSSNNTISIPEKKQKNNVSYWDMHNNVPVTTEKNANNRPQQKSQSTVETPVAYNNAPKQNTTDNNIQKAFVPPDYTKNQNSGGSFEYMTVILCISVLLLIMGII